MFLATLKELNLFVLPKPNFDIPASDCDLICSHSRTGDSDLSCVSHTFNMQQFNDNSGVLGDINTRRKRRRNTITFPLRKARDSFWHPVSLDKGPSMVNGPDSFPSIAKSQDPTTLFSNGIASIMHTRSSESSSGAKVRIVTPANPPSSIRRRLREDLRSFYDSSPKHDRSQIHGSKAVSAKVQKASENVRYGLSRKGKEKRYSAPPVFPSATVQTNVPISLTRLPPPVVQKYQNQRLRSHQDIPSNPSYPSKLFELDLSPIIEDVHAFSDQLPAFFSGGTQTNAGSVDSPMNSSTTSYGELLYDKSAESFELSDSDLLGDLYHHHHDEKNQWIEHQESQEWKGLPLVSMREETVKNREHRVPGDILPELTLTLPTPAFDCSVEFINFGFEALRGQTYGELPQSSCHLRAGVVEIDEALELRSSPPSVHSCYPDNDAFQTYNLDSDGTMNTLSHLDRVTSSDSVDGNVLELDRSRNYTPPASLVAQNHIGKACHPGNAEAAVLGDPGTLRLGNRLSRFGRYLLRRVKLFSLSGNKHRTSNNNGKELWSVKKITDVFSIYSDQLPKSRDSAALDSPTEEDLKKKQAADNAKKLGQHSLRRAGT